MTPRSGPRQRVNFPGVGPKAARLFANACCRRYRPAYLHGPGAVQKHRSAGRCATTVKDSKGRYVDGLTPQDLILYDNNVPQAIQMDWMTYPIDLVVTVQTS